MAGHELLRLMKTRFVKNSSFRRYALTYLVQFYWMSRDLRSLRQLLRLHDFDRSYGIKIYLGIPLNGRGLVGEYVYLKGRQSRFLDRQRSLVVKQADVLLKEYKRNRGKDLLQDFAARYRSISRKLAEALNGIHEHNNSFSLLSTRFPLEKYDQRHKFYAKLAELGEEAENRARVALGVPKIGEGWVSETMLFHTIKSLFPNCSIIHHYWTVWLGKQHLDIYIEDLKVAVEYQGLQHFQPVPRFGGATHFKKQVLLDERKRRLCAKNGVQLIFVNYDDDYTAEELKDIILTKAGQ